MQIINLELDHYNFYWPFLSEGLILEDNGLMCGILLTF